MHTRRRRLTLSNHMGTLVIALGATLLLDIDLLLLPVPPCQRRSKGLMREVSAASSCCSAPDSFPCDNLEIRVPPYTDTHSDKEHKYIPSTSPLGRIGVPGYMQPASAHTHEIYKKMTHEHVHSLDVELQYGPTHTTTMTITDILGPATLCIPLSIHTFWALQDLPRQCSQILTYGLYCWIDCRGGSQSHKKTCLLTKTISVIYSQGAYYFNLGLCTQSTSWAPHSILQHPDKRKGCCAVYWLCH